jgi:hypothetical protein
LGSVNSGTNAAGGWYESEKVRFRAGTPEKIGGWVRISDETYEGVCRSLWNWVTLTGANLVGVGTNLKFYIESGGSYNDITPLRVVPAPTINNNPFTLTASTTVTVTDTAHGCVTGDFVTFSGAATIGGGGTNVTAAVLNQEFQVTVVDVNTYTIVISVTPNATAISGSPGGGASVVAAYQINVGPEYAVPLIGWGAGPWGAGLWGTGGTSTSSLRLWSQSNFGEDLLINPRGGGLYYWDQTNGLNTRAVLVSSIMGADANVPSVVLSVFVSDASRFVFAFGCDDYSSSTLNPMLIRWSDQEDFLIWTPAPTNQAGSLQLSHGSEIVTSIQARQEIVVFTDSAIYSLQYVGPPVVWASQLLGDNVSIIGPNAVCLASGVVYWMGIDKFYKYDGRVQTLRCDLRQYIYNDINLEQNQQVFAGTNEGFNEIWWFYCSANSTVIDKYVTFNYVENNNEGVWAYGSLGRTAWLDSGLRDYPLAATYSYNLVNHEQGDDNGEGASLVAINAIIASAEFDIDDGDHFGFVWRMLPDITFRGSTAVSPQVTMTLIPMQNSGSGYNDPISLGGNENATVTRTSTAVIEQFTGQVYVRVRGRQMILQVESNQLGCTWQLGATRIDIKQDGRRGNS